MNKNAFKQRMQQLKNYRESNPGKTYVDFKSHMTTQNDVYRYEDGGITEDNEQLQFLQNWFDKRKKTGRFDKQLQYVKYNMQDARDTKVTKSPELIQKYIKQNNVKLSPNSVVGGYYDWAKKEIVLNDGYVENRDALLHEYTHALKLHRPKDIIDNITNGAYVFNRGKELNDYYTDSEEVYPRLMEFRKANKLDPEKVYGIPDVRQWRRTGKDTDFLNTYTEDDVILDLINNVAAVPSKVRAYEDGGETPIKGYWNKRNPGQYVAPVAYDYSGEAEYRSTLPEVEVRANKVIPKTTSQRMSEAMTDTDKKIMRGAWDLAQWTPLGDPQMVADIYTDVKDQSYGSLAATAGLLVVPSFLRRPIKAVGRQINKGIKWVNAPWIIKGLGKPINDIPTKYSTLLDKTIGLPNNSQYTKNRIFEGKSMFGPKSTEIQTNVGQAYRSTKRNQLQDILETGYVRPKSGKLKGGHYGESFWSTGNPQFTTKGEVVLETKPNIFGNVDINRSVHVSDLQRIYLDGVNILDGKIHGYEYGGETPIKG